MRETADVRALQALRTAEGRRLLAAIGPYDPADALRVGAALRRDGHDEALVAAAMTQARLRARGQAKFGPLADRLLFTDDGLQQASRPAVAALHARRYRDAGVATVLDLCCGIGGDLLPMATAGLHVTGVDRDPLTAAVAAANIDELGLAERAQVRCADVADVDLTGAGSVFVDPSRRRRSGRTFDPRSYSPPFDAVLAMADRVAATGAKLAPGIPHGVLPAQAEAEWVSDRGDVVECGLWFGPLAGAHPRRATLLPGGETVTGTGTWRAPVRPVGRWLLEPDGAVLRAGLVAEVAESVSAGLVDPTIGYLTADEPVRTPFAASYEVTDVVPFGLKRLRTMLRERGIGSLTVKKRGTAVQPEELRRSLRLEGDGTATIVLTRVAGEQTVLFVRPQPRTSTT